MPSFIFSFFIWTLFWTVNAVAAESVLTVFNDSGKDILNLLAVDKAGQKPEERFLRLDLAPGMNARIENPGAIDELRLDNGLALVKFDGLPVSQISALTFSGSDSADLIIEMADGQKIEKKGKIESLIPAPGEKLVCELSRFRPRMPMSEVCLILPEKTPTDDNGALLTGLGFGGFVWAGRLTPEIKEGEAANLLLEHMELRRPFNEEDVYRLVDTLYKQGYMPWQAEFPKADLDFADMPDTNQSDRRKVLLDVLGRYFEDKAGEATLMFAPGEMIGALANSDMPERDVQLFTLVIKPKSGIMLLDVAAYDGDKS